MTGRAFSGEMSKEERFPLLLLLPLTSFLLFLGPKDCLSLTGPSKVQGIVGKSLTVQCSYEESYKTVHKYWGTMKTLYCSTIIDTRGPKAKDRMSIRDLPENQTFTVTMENLTEADAGEYCCAIGKTFFDLKVKITISIFPAPTVVPHRYSTISTTEETVVMNEIEEGKTSKETSDSMQHPGPGILDKPGILLLILGLLIILLLGAFYLAWKMVKAGKNPMVFLDPDQMANEPCYANLELQGRPSNHESCIQSYPSVEYSTVATSQEQSVTYSTLPFLVDNQNTAWETRQHQEEKTMYSTIKM